MSLPQSITRPDFSKRYWLFYDSNGYAFGINALVDSYDTIDEAIRDQRAEIYPDWRIPKGHVLDTLERKIVAFITEGGYQTYSISKRSTRAFFRHAFWITINDKKWNIELDNLHGAENRWIYKCLI